MKFFQVDPEKIIFLEQETREQENHFQTHENGNVLVEIYLRSVGNFPQHRGEIFNNWLLNMNLKGSV